MVRIVDKLHKAVSALEDFTTRQWYFKCDNVLKLNAQLKGSDKEVSLWFPFPFSKNNSLSLNRPLHLISVTYTGQRIGKIMSSGWESLSWRRTTLLFLRLEGTLEGMLLLLSWKCLTILLIRLYYVDRLLSFGLLFGIWHMFAMRSQVARRMWFFLTTLAMRMYSVLNDRS